MTSSRVQDFKVIKADIVSDADIPLLNVIIPLPIEKGRAEGELDAQIEKNSFASTKMRRNLLDPILHCHYNESSRK